MKTVTFTFVGGGSDEVAQAFYTWVVDGGMEDQLIDGLTDLTAKNIDVDGIMDFNNDTLDIAFKSQITS